MKLFGFKFSVGPNKVKEKNASDSRLNRIDTDGFISPKYSGNTYQSGAKRYMDRNEAITKYRLICSNHEIDRAVGEICDEAIAYDTEGDVVKIVFKETNDKKISDNMKEFVKTEFDNVLKLYDFNNNAYTMFRDWYIDGCSYYYLTISDDPKEGINSIESIDPLAIEVKTVKDNEYYVLKNTDKTISPDAVIYTDSGRYDASGDSTSWLDVCIKPLNQLEAVEDSQVIYRVARAPERRVFNIPTGGLPTHKANEVLQNAIDTFKTKIQYNPVTGEVTDSNKNFMSMLEDYWFPIRKDGNSASIDTLSGAQNLGEIEDINYFREKFFRSLNIPIARLVSDYQYSTGRSGEIIRDEIKFAKFIRRLRNSFSKCLRDTLKVQLILKGIITEDEWEDVKHYIMLDYTTDNYYEELKELEVLSSRFSLMSDTQQLVDNGYYKKEWAQREILKLTEEEIKETQENDEDEEIEDIRPNPAGAPRPRPAQGPANPNIERMAAEQGAPAGQASPDASGSIGATPQQSATTGPTPQQSAIASNEV